ncbi:Regulating synaptic membrane exocytosis protein 2 [Nymphon striatum]|nr:Regulating synaptic membrane exocytosis protein 2 [Nymphon striatum]
MSRIAFHIAINTLHTTTRKIVYAMPPSHFFRFTSQRQCFHLVFLVNIVKEKEKVNQNEMKVGCCTVAYLASGTKKKQDEVKVLEDSIKKLSDEKVKSSGSGELDATCRICLRTKFADGVGHLCNYCNIRCCARCGGKVSLRSGKVIWVCILCRKKQELLIKTGNWLHTTMGGKQLTPNEMEKFVDIGSRSETASVRSDTSSIVKGKLERALSSEKENIQQGLNRPPLQRTTSQGREPVRRQYSYGDPRSSDSHRPSSNESGRILPNPSETRRRCSISDLSDATLRDESRAFREKNRYHDTSHESSNDRTRDSPIEYDRSRSREHSCDRHRDFMDDRSCDSRCYTESSLDRHRNIEEDRRSRSDRSGTRGANKGNRRKVESVVRNDSLSSDQSESVRPPPPKPHKHKSRGKQKHREISGSSSDDEVRSTPDYTSCDEPEIESESVSEKGELVECLSRSNRHDSHKWQNVESTCDSQKNFSSSSRKIVRFDYVNDSQRRRCPVLYDSSSYSVEDDDPHVKDSGIDTSSSATLNEENNNKNPCTWKPSSDGTKYTGYLTLKKTIKEGIGTSDPAILGLKVAGGKYLLNGKIGAIIEKVKKGSIADTVGQLKPGDEILQWNKQSLQGRSIKDVSDIIADTKQDAEVELIIRIRLLTRANAGNYQLDPRKPDMYHDGRPSVTITSPGSPGTVRSKPHSIKGSPRVQLKLWYDSQKQTFYVTVICATDIPLKGPSRKTRNLYVKLYLLPDRGAESKRRTKPIANTNEPKWNVKFIYDCVRWSDLKLNSLEVTLWDYNPKCASDFLGEYVIDINSAPLDNQPEWYSLHDETSQLRSRHNMYIDSEIASSITSADRLSPPSTISRLSDSDASEYDEEFMRVDRKLIGGDGASISSIGSSCSPPLVSEDSSEMVIDTHRLSRRDISLSSIHSTRRRPNIVLSKDDYQYHRGVLGQQNNPNVITDSARLRSRSAAQSPIYDSHSGRSRSKSPNRRGLSDSRSLSPPGARPSSPHGGHRQIVENRRTTQSANATPTGTPSPKKRQLPQIPTAYHSKSFNREFNEKAKQVRIRMEIYKGVSTITPVGMYSDTEIVTRSEKPHSYHRGSYMMQQDIDRLNSGMMSMSLSGDRDSDDAASECSSVSKMSVNSAFSTQSERPRGARSFSKFSSRMMNYGPVHQRQNYAIRMQRSPSNSSDLPPEKTDGSLSDTAVTSGEMINDGKRDHSSANRMAQYMGLSKKSRSTSQLSASGRKKRLGFRKKDSTRIRVQRSEEICPHDYQYLKQSSSQSSDGEGSVSSESAHYIPSFRSAQEDLLLGSFLEDLGPGQLVGRQNLVTPCRGDIQLSLIDTKGSLDVEVIRARGLSAKPNSKLLPAPYVKVYLVRGKQIVVKAKTQIARRTLDPLYQQILHLVKSYHDCILQVTVWGDYGRLEKKVFMGAAQIKLDTLDLSNIVIGWYKLYNTPSVPDTSCNTKTMMSSKGSFG